MYQSLLGGGRSSPGNVTSAFAAALALAIALAATALALAPLLPCGE